MIIIISYEFLLKCRIDKILFYYTETSLWALVPSEDRRLLLSCSPYDSACLWDISDDLSKLQPEDAPTPLQVIDHCYMAVFNRAATIIAGSDERHATILYATQTGQKLIELYDPASTAPTYRTNRPCFSPCDDLILSDGKK